jgi:hypothetical protein
LRSSSEVVGFFPSGQSSHSTPQLSHFAIVCPVAQTYIYGSNDLAAAAVTQIFLLTGSGEGCQYLQIRIHAAAAYA